jgi:hypothetical protein
MRHLARWMRPERRHVAWTFKPGKAWTAPPYGKRVDRLVRFLMKE